MGNFNSIYKLLMFSWKECNSVTSGLQNSRKTEFFRSSNFAELLSFKLTCAVLNYFLHFLLWKLVDNYQPLKGKQLYARSNQIRPSVLISMVSFPWLITQKPFKAKVIRILNWGVFNFIYEIKANKTQTSQAKQILQFS